jgi:ubiquinone biosynthesis protein COQ4
MRLTVMVKYRQALRAMSVLWWKPFEFDALNLMVDAVSLAWPVQTWYRRMLERAPKEQVEHLRELTKRPLDIDALLRLPENTFGYRYAMFFKEHYIAAGGHVGAAPGLTATFDRDWVTHRFFKIHDILHAIAGFGVDVPGEMGLQVFNMMNLREPYGIASVAATPYMMLRYGKPVKMLKEMIRGYELSGKAYNLFFAPFEEMWELDFDEVRARVGLIDRAPTYA